MSAVISPVETTELAPGYRIPRIVRGGWQLAGDHGPVERERAISDMGAFLDAGQQFLLSQAVALGVHDWAAALLQPFRTLRLA